MPVTVMPSGTKVNLTGDADLDAKNTAFAEAFNKAHGGDKSLAKIDKEARAQLKQLQEETRLWEQIAQSSGLSTSAILKTVDHVKGLKNAFEKLFTSAKDIEKLRADPRFKPAYAAYSAVKQADIAKLPAAEQAKAERELREIGGLKPEAAKFLAESIKLMSQHRGPGSRMGLVPAGTGGGSLANVSAMADWTNQTGTPRTDYKTAAATRAKAEARAAAEVARAIEVAEYHEGSPTGRKGIPYGGAAEIPEGPKKPPPDKGFGVADIYALGKGPVGWLYETVKVLHKGFNEFADFLKPATDGLETISLTARTAGLSMEAISKSTLGAGTIAALGYSPDYAKLGYSQDVVARASRKYGLSQSITEATAQAALMSQTTGTGAMTFEQWTGVMGRMAGAGVMSTKPEAIYGFASAMRENINKALKAGIPAEQEFDNFGKGLATAIGLGLEMTPQELSNYMAQGMQTGFAPLRTGETQTGAMQEYAQMADKIASQPLEIGALSHMLGGGAWTMEKIQSVAKARGIDIPDVTPEFTKQFNQSTTLEQLARLRNWGMLQSLVQGSMTGMFDELPGGINRAQLFLPKNAANMYDVGKGIYTLPKAGDVGGAPADPGMVLKNLIESGWNAVTSPDLTAGREVEQARIAENLILSATALKGLGQATAAVTVEMADLSNTLFTFVNKLKDGGSISEAAHAAAATPGGRATKGFLGKIADAGGPAPYGLFP